MPQRILLQYLLAAAVFLSACSQGNRTLPRYGETQVVEGDTLYHRIPDFSFTDQDSATITNATFAEGIYIADFFFTSCPTICPKVKAQMLRIYERFAAEPSLKFISHSIDTKRDSVPVLRRYADKIGISSERWHLVTGDKAALFRIAKDYFSVALEDADAPGGYDHSGYIILIDRDRHIRAFCDGTDPEAVDKFMGDIQTLLDE